jgi:hypothetical protein
MFFNEVVGKKNKHKNRKAIWVEYTNQNLWLWLFKTSGNMYSGKIKQQ